MKKYIVLLFLALVLSSLGCKGIIKTPSAPALPPTATPTLIPGCGVSVVGTGGLTFPTATPGGTPDPTATPGPTVAVTPYPTPLIGTVAGVIRNLSEWSAAYGTAVAPVDFSRQILIQVPVYSGCLGSDYIANVCWNDTQVTVSMDQSLPGPGEPICNHTNTNFTYLVAVPQCNLPVVMETDGYTTY